MTSSKNLANSTSIIFFGNEELATGYSPSEAIILNDLLDNGYHIEMVILKKSSQSAKVFAVEKLASARGIAVAYPCTNEELIETLNGIESKVGVLAAYGRIVPSEVIDSFEFGIVNIHPSLLPKYRGSTPIETTILNGDRETGASLMQLETQMDTGPIYAKQSVDIKGTESKQELCQRLATIGANLLTKNLPKILSGTLNPREQDHDAASFTRQISKQDGRLKTGSFSAIDLERQIRAYQGWPTSYFFIQNKRVIVIDARVVNTDIPTGRLVVQEKKLLLGCNGGSLELKSLKPEGKNELSAVEFINSQSGLSTTNQQIID